jgi:hypothetical protein
MSSQARFLFAPSADLDARGTPAKLEAKPEVTEICGWLVPAGCVTYMSAIDLAC